MLRGGVAQGVFEDNDSIHLVMELCEGGALLERIDKRKYSEVRGGGSGGGGRAGRAGGARRRRSKPPAAALHWPGR